MPRLLWRGNPYDDLVPVQSPLDICLIAIAGVAVLGASVSAQDRLKTMPGYEQYQRMSKEIAGAVKPGTSAV